MPVSTPSRHAVLIRDGFIDKKATPFRELKDGDIFELYETTGELVGGCIYQACSDVYNTDGVATIQVVQYSQGTVTEL